MDNMWPSIADGDNHINMSTIFTGIFRIFPQWAFETNPCSSSRCRAAERGVCVNWTSHLVMIRDQANTKLINLMHDVSWLDGFDGKFHIIDYESSTNSKIRVLKSSEAQKNHQKDGLGESIRWNFPKLNTISFQYASLHSMEEYRSLFVTII